jgi:hypothetical protein
MAFADGVSRQRVSASQLRRPALRSGRLHAGVVVQASAHVMQAPIVMRKQACYATVSRPVQEGTGRATLTTQSARHPLGATAAATARARSLECVAQLSTDPGPPGRASLGRRFPPPPPPPWTPHPRHPPSLRNPQGGGALWLRALEARCARAPYAQGGNGARPRAPVWRPSRPAACSDQGARLRGAEAGAWPGARSCGA